VANAPQRTVNQQRHPGPWSSEQSVPAIARSLMPAVREHAAEVTDTSSHAAVGTPGHAAERGTARAMVVAFCPGQRPVPLGRASQPVWSSVVAPAEFFFTDSMPLRALALVS